MRVAVSVTQTRLCFLSRCARDDFEMDPSSTHGGQTRSAISQRNTSISVREGIEEKYADVWGVLSHWQMISLNRTPSTSYYIDLWKSCRPVSMDFHLLWKQGFSRSLLNGWSFDFFFFSLKGNNDGKNTSVILLLSGQKIVFCYFHKYFLTVYILL